MVKQPQTQREAVETHIFIYDLAYTSFLIGFSDGCG